jgi:hypothetical protein
MARRAAVTMLAAVLCLALAAHTGAFKAEDLSGMKFSALSKLAEKEGVAAEKIDEAMEADSPKKALIAILTPLAEKDAAEEESCSAEPVEGDTGSCGGEEEEGPEELEPTAWNPDGPGGWHLGPDAPYGMDKCTIKKVPCSSIKTENDVKKLWQGAVPVMLTGCEDVGSNNPLKALKAELVRDKLKAKYAEEKVVLEPAIPGPWGKDGGVFDIKKATGGPNAKTQRASFEKFVQYLEQPLEHIGLVHAYSENNPNLAEDTARDADFGFSGSRCYRKSTWHRRHGADSLLCSDTEDKEVCKMLKTEGKCQSAQGVTGCKATCGNCVQEVQKAKTRNDPPIIKFLQSHEQPIWSIGPIHADTLFNQVEGARWFWSAYGRKLWFVAPKEKPPQQDLVWGSPWNVMENYPEAFTETPGSSVPPESCVQNPGDLLWLPPFAWHASATIDESMIIGAHHQLEVDAALTPRWYFDENIQFQEIKIEDNKVTIVGKANQDPSLATMKKLRDLKPHDANANINVARKLYNDGAEGGTEHTPESLEVMLTILGEYFDRVIGAFSAKPSRLETEQFDMFVEKQLTNPLVMEYFSKSKMDPDDYPLALPMRQRIAAYLKDKWAQVWEVRPQEEFDPRVSELFERWEHGLDQLRASHILLKHNESFSSHSPHDEEGLIIAARSPKMAYDMAVELIAENKLTKLTDKTDPSIGDKFAELVTAKSDDSGTASNDPPGDNGWFGAGQVVHEFYKAAKSIRPGTVVSEPIESKFGYHIIYRTR